LENDEAIAEHMLSLTPFETADQRIAWLSCSSSVSSGGSNDHTQIFVTKQEARG
jgi:uncharacterized protein (UPF0262 family)